MARGEHADEVWTATFSPDGSLLAAGCHSGVIRLWDVYTQDPIGTLSGHKGWISSLTFSRDGRLLASGCHDGTVKVWDVQCRTLIHSWPVRPRGDDGKPFATMIIGGKRSRGGGQIDTLAFSPDGTMLVCGLGYGERDRRFVHFAFLDVSNFRSAGELTYTFDEQKYSEELQTAIFIDRQILVAAVSASTVVERDFLSRTCTVRPGFLYIDVIRRRELLRIMDSGSATTMMRILPGGRRFVEAREDGSVNVWPIRKGSPSQKTRPHNDSVECAEMTRDGQLLATGGWDRVVRVTDLVTGSLIAWTPTADRVIALWFEPARHELLVAEAGGPAHLPNIYRLALAGFEPAPIARTKMLPTGRMR